METNYHPMLNDVLLYFCKMDMYYFLLSIVLYIHHGTHDHNVVFEFFYKLIFQNKLNMLMNGSNIYPIQPCKIFYIFYLRMYILYTVAFGIEIIVSNKFKFIYHL